MKIYIFIIYLTTMCFIGSAQTITESYFKVRKENWKPDFKKTSKDTLHSNLVYSGAIREKVIIHYLFKEYQKITGKDLDTSNSIFILKKKTHMNEDIVIWNTSDTVYTQTLLSINYIKEPQRLNLISFNNDEINEDSAYTSRVMDMVSKVKPEEIQCKIDEKTLDKNGKIKLVLDGSTFELYLFIKKDSNYDVRKFSIYNPRFN